MVSLMRRPSKNSSFVDSDMMEDDEIEAGEFESGASESDDEEGGGDIKLQEPKKDSIYDRDGLGDKLEDFKWPENAGWIHKLSVDIKQEQEVDVNDDLARELAFYTQALQGTREAFEKLESLKLPFLRPPDYYAEMVKSDSHMQKVRGRLLAEKKNIEEAEERRKARDSKKHSKEVQAKKMKERAKQKKDEIENVKKWRKQRQQSGFAGGEKGEDLDMPFEEGKVKKKPWAAPGDRSGGKARQFGNKKKGFDKQRKSKEFKNSKFGHGGRKGLRKQNTAETTNDFSSFSKSETQGNNKKRKR